MCKHGRGVDCLTSNVKLSVILICVSRLLSWKKLLDRDMPSPFRPKVGHVDSVENFDKLWTDMAPEDSPCNTPPAADLNTFQVLRANFVCLLASVICNGLSVKSG